MPRVNTLEMRESAKFCPDCGEELCTICGEHWADCEHPSEMQEDEYAYFKRNGKLFARRKNINNEQN